MRILDRNIAQLTHDEDVPVVFYRAPGDVLVESPTRKSPFIIILAWYSDIIDR